CLQRIVVPQAPAAGESKFILSGSQPAKPRPTSAASDSTSGSRQPPASPMAIAIVAALLALVGGAGATLYIFRGKIFKPTVQQAKASTNQTAKHKAAAAS